MNPQDQRDGLIDRLRTLDTTPPYTRGDSLGAAGAVRGRYRRWRQGQVRVAGAIVSVVLLLGAFTFLARPWAVDGVASVPAAVDSPVRWAPRGDLAGDRELVARAERTWLDHPRPPAGDVHAFYAQRSPASWGNLHLVVVALATADENGRTTVAWVTTALSAGEPDTGRLRVRAIEEVSADRGAIGFVAATPAPGDTPIPGGGGFAVALNTPGSINVRAYSMLITDGPPEPSRSGRPDHWEITPPGVNAWNTTLYTEHTPSTAWDDAAAPSLDDPTARPVTLTERDGKHSAHSTSPEEFTPGDLVVSEMGILGAIANSEGLVDTTAGALNGLGSFRSVENHIPGTLTTDWQDRIYFLPTGPGEAAYEDRIEFFIPERPALRFRMGLLYPSPRGLQVITPMSAAGAKHAYVISTK